MTEARGDALDRVVGRGWRPELCVWELTLACPLRCVHCGSRAGEARPNEMHADRCLRLADELADLGCQRVTLSGGEPTLAPHWPTVAEALGRRGVYVNMVTSGFFPTRTAADRLARRARDAGLGNVALSVDGPEAVHERIRGKGTFARMRQAAEAFCAAGLPLAAITTINRWNLPRLEQLAELVREMGVRDWQVQLAKPMGNLAHHHGHQPPDVTLRPEQLPALEQRLARLKKAGGVSLHLGDSIGYFGPHGDELRPDNGWRGCMAGLRGIGIEADGGVKGCLSLQATTNGKDPFVEGNLRRQSLAEIWSQPGAFPYNRDFTPDSLDGPCARCEQASVCRGGARCMAAAANGTTSHDPYCGQAVRDKKGEKSRRWKTKVLTAAAAGLLLTLGPVTSRGDRCMKAGEAGTKAREAGTRAKDRGAQPDYGPMVAEYGAPACSCDMFDGGPADAGKTRDYGTPVAEYGAPACSMLPPGSKH